MNAKPAPAADVKGAKNEDLPDIREKREDYNPIPISNSNGAVRERYPVV